MDTYRLVKRTLPYEYESLGGLLMRAAQANHYRSPQDILVFALDSCSTNPRVDVAQIPKLADYMRNTVAELSQLSGICQHIPKKGTVWQINGEWIRRAAFLNFKHSPICPKCLHEAPYLRGEWHLAFNSTCWLHQCQLVSHCPQCRRLLTSSRYSPERCVCNFDLRESPVEWAHPDELLIARLIANRRHGSLVLDSLCLPSMQIENLARLSLEGLCHSLWFLGHHLFGNFNLGPGMAHRKLDRVEVLSMIQGFFWLLSDWPNRLEKTLAKRMVQNATWSGNNATQCLLGPVQNYFETHIAPGDTRFIAQPYETFVRQLVIKLGKKHRPTQFDSPQLELDLE